MKTAEKNLWKWLSNARLHYRDTLHMDRIENGVGQGFPDVEGYLRDYGGLLIELKTAARPVRKGGIVRVKVRIEQIRWHLKRRKAGQRTWFLVQVGSGAKAARYLLPGVLGELIGEGMKEQNMLQLGRLVKTPEEAVHFAADRGA